MKWKLSTFLKSLPARLGRIPGALRLWRAAGELVTHDGIETAGFIAYTALVSLFPFLIFLFTLAGLFKYTLAVESLLTTVFALMPREVERALMPIIHEVLGTEAPALAAASIIGTLWVTSSGVEALRRGLNEAYDVKETRALWVRRIHSAFFVLLAGAGAIAGGFLLIGMPLGIDWLKGRMHLPEALIAGVTAARYLLAVLVLTGLNSLFYHSLPNRRLTWRSTLPGALLAAVLWVALASFFSLYLSTSGDYTVTYGSLGGVVITLLFLHFSAIIFLLGAEFNATSREGVSPREPATKDRRRKKA